MTLKAKEVNSVFYLHVSNEFKKKKKRERERETKQNPLNFLKVCNGVQRINGMEISLCERRHSHELPVFKLS